MNTLRLASFGMRGYVGRSLTPGVVIDFASAFGAFVEGGPVLLGRDTRYSSPMLHQAVLAGLLSSGCEVIDLGVCPTAIVQFAVKRHEAAGAVSISGGHNAVGCNALTLIGRDGAFLEPTGGEYVLDCFHASDFRRCDWQHMGERREADDPTRDYLKALLEHVDAAAVRRAGFTVVIDPAGGAGCAYLDPFAEALGFTLIPVNGEPSGHPAREIEPRPRNARQIASTITHLKGDAGFVLSSDMGRLALVTEKGETASEEYTFAVIADHVLRKQAGTVVTNCCTTRTIDDIAARRGVKVVKTPVGQAYVASALADEQGVIGGEGNGSVCLPAFSYAFDGFLMMALVLEAMATTGTGLSSLLSALPRYEIVKTNVPCSSRAGYRALEKAKSILAKDATGVMDLTDGLRVDWEEGWMHIRPSRTEQLVRVISEAGTHEAAKRRAEEAVRIIEGAS